MEWRGREWRGGEGRGGKGRAGQGRVPDCLGGLSRVWISSRSTRPWNGQPPSIDYEYDHSFDSYNVFGQLIRFSVHFKVELIINFLTSKDNSMFGELVLSLCYSF